MNDRHNARMMAFIYYCMDVPLAQVAGLVGGTITTIKQWAETDSWATWRPALQRQAAAQGVPPWALKIVEGQADTKRQLAELGQQVAELAARLPTAGSDATWHGPRPPHDLAELNRQLEDLKAGLEEPPAPA